MTFDYGTIYGLNKSDPINSRVYLSWIPVSGTSSANANTAVIPNQDIYYVEDNENQSIFSFVGGSTITPDLYEYKVSFGNGTGTSSILLENTISYTAPTSSPTYIGLKRVSSSSYYLYYLDLTLGSPFTIDFRRYEIGTGTDISLASETLAFSVSTTQTAIIGRSLYVSFSRVSGSDRIVYLYQLDMDSELIYNLDEVNLSTSTIAVNGLVNFYGVLEVNGWVKLWIDYATLDNTPGNERLTHKVYFGGSTTEILEIYPYDNTKATSVLDRQKYIYNGRDTKIARTWIYDGTTYYFVIDSVSGGSSSTVDIIPDTNPLRFISSGSFPKIGFSGGIYYWLDSNGQSTGAISLSGATIRAIFQTLDSINGSMYVSALVGGVDNKMLSVDPYTGTILETYDISNFPFATLGSIILATNHGNFFIQRGTPFNVAYLDNAPPVSGVGECQIIEMN